jgi:hypothetical protein
MISVSVVVWKIGKKWPCDSTCCRRVWEFTRLPLWATAIMLSEEVTTSGWALAGLEEPVVE